MGRNRAIELNQKKRQEKDEGSITEDMAADEIKGREQNLIRGEPGEKGEYIGTNEERGRARK